MLTLEQFQAVLPEKVKKTINPELILAINNTLSNPAEMENYRDNLLGYANVMRDGRFKLQSYLDAVRYISFKLMGDSNQNAYIKTFPDKYNDFLVAGVASKDIASYISAYNKGKLVNLIFEQTLIPTHVLNADLFQDALNTQAELMRGATSEKVRSDAANSILTHLKKPETSKIELAITNVEDDSIKELRAATLNLVAQQKLSLQAGISTPKQIAEAALTIEGEFTKE